MLKVTCPPLEHPLQQYLNRRHQRDAAWNSLYGEPSSAQVKIKQTLRSVFHDKCGYCETIEAQTVDHFWPQNTAEKRWDWDNFILACDVCQSHKLARPPVDDQGYQMVNPRFDEPLHFLYIDFETGIIEPRPRSEESLARGRVTLDRLGLSQRTSLQDERRRKLGDVVHYILDVIEAPDEIAADAAWHHLVDHLRPSRPYLSIIRQLFLTQNRYHPLIDALKRLRPEIYEVIRDWCLPLNAVNP